MKEMKNWKINGTPRLVVENTSLSLGARLLYVILRGYLSPVTESAARKVEIEGFKIQHFLDARRALSDCRRAVGMAHVQRPESELPRSDPQFR
jgi:hypothetical protein